MKKNLSKKTAFSLLELSIVILIISILIVGSMSASITVVNNSKYKVTRDRMTEIYKALGNYLLTNKALPCPASILDLKSSSTTYGTAGTTAGTCNAGAGVYVGSGGHSAQLAYGMLPAQALGLSADMVEDGFGSKFTYIVSKRFTNPTLVSTSDGFGSVSPAYGFSSPTAGFITVKENLGSGYQVNTNDAIFVIISHGGNKYGAYNNNSATQNSASSDADEQHNYGSTTTFYNVDNWFVASSVNSDTFDDVVFYKTRNNMLIDYNALSLIVCPATSVTDVSCNNGSPCNWIQAYYNQTIASTESCSATYSSTVLKPTKRCDAFGNWQPGFINPCTQ